LSNGLTQALAGRLYRNITGGLSADSTVREIRSLRRAGYRAGYRVG
jgi:hypothetical protein